jgi:hypothetical protein
MVAFFLAWLRRHFAVGQSRLRCALYLHADLDLDTATAYWSGVCDVPVGQFTKPYHPVARPPSSGDVARMAA